MNRISQYCCAGVLLSAREGKEDLKWFVSVQNPVTPDRWRTGFFCGPAYYLKGKSIKDLIL